MKQKGGPEEEDFTQRAQSDAKICRGICMGDTAYKRGGGGDYDVCRNSLSPYYYYYYY